MTVDHAHRHVADVARRVREYRKAPRETQLAALAELYRRAGSQTTSMWSNGLLAFVPIVTLFGTMLLAAYGIWTQSEIAYWNVYVQQGDAPGVREQIERWGDGVTSMTDGPNALARGLIEWAQILVVLLVVGALVAIGLSLRASHARGVALAWIAVYEQVLDEPVSPVLTPRRGLMRWTAPHHTLASNLERLTSGVKKRSNG